MGNQVKSRLINYDDAGMYVAMWIGKRPDWYIPTTPGLSLWQDKMRDEVEFQAVQAAARRTREQEQLRAVFEIQTEMLDNSLDA